MQTFLEIPVGRQRLAACLHRPEPGRSVMAAPVVVCCHGLTGSRVGSCYRFVALARQLVEENVACLRFDFRGCGESDGRFVDLTSSSLIQDLRAVVAVIDRLPGCDPTRIGIVGSSFGAFTASHAAAEIEALRCLVFWAPVADAMKLAREQMPEAAWQFLGKQGWVEHHGLPLGAGFFEKLPETHAPAALARCGRPVLIFHGRGDKQVPIEHGRAYEAALREAGIQVEFHVVEVDDHGMRSVSANEKLLSRSVTWLRRFLHPDSVAESTS